MVRVDRIGAVLERATSSMYGVCTSRWSDIESTDIHIVLDANNKIVDVTHKF